MKKIKETWSSINKVAFFCFGGISVALIIAGFIMPPAGKIDPSVLTAVGEFFAFATLGTVIYGVNRGTDVTVKHKDTEIKLNNPDESHSKK